MKAPFPIDNRGLQNFLDARKRDAAVLAAVRAIVQTDVAWPGAKWIGQRIGASQPAVSRSLHRLRGRGAIDFVSTTHGLRDIRVCQ